MTTSFGNGVWQLITQSDLLTKFILLALFCMNILCTALFLYKLVLNRLKLRELKQARSRLKNITSVEDFRTATAELSSTMPGYLIKQTMNAVKNAGGAHPLHISLTPSQLEQTEQTIEQTIDDLLQAEQSYLPILFSCAAVSPLIGLFGTIWGLIHAFVGISTRQSADIATVAPGIAEALITTLGGLCVAIPTLMMYHYLNSKYKTIEHQLINLAYQLNTLVIKFFAPGDRA